MHRVDTSSAAASLPSPQATGTPGYFIQGSPSGPVFATVPGPDWFNMVQEELHHLCVFYGITPDQTKADFTQIRQAIQAALVSQTDLLAHQRIALLMFNRQADHTIPPAGLVGDFYDSFSDDTGIDAGSSNETWSPGELRNYDVGPIGSTDIGTSGQHIDDGRGWTDTANLYDDSTANNATGPTTAAAGDYLGQLFAEAKAIGKVRFFNDIGATDSGIDDGSVEYSDNGVDWTEVATVTGATQNDWVEITWSAAGAHLYWRLKGATWYKGNGNQIREIEWFEFDNGSAAAMDYRSEAQEMAVEPTGSILTFVISDVDAGGNIASQLGSSILGYVSKDDGSTWEPVTLAIVESASGIYTVSGSIPTMSVTGDQTVRQRLVLPATDRYAVQAIGTQAI